MEVCKCNASVPQTATLLVGQEFLLLQTRSLILQAAGYAVRATSPEEAIHEFKSGGFDVVVLCHSVPAADRKRLTWCVREVQPLTPVLFIADLFGEHDTLCDATIEPDPRKLLSGLKAAVIRGVRRDSQK